MNKSRGWNQLLIRIVKTCGNSITFPLKLIFKFMINEDVFLEDLKKSIVVPFIKKNQDFRPIGLLPIFKSNVFEILLV